MNGAPLAISDADRLRRLVLVLLFVGLAGIGAELLALQHYEDSWQLVPLFLIVVTAAILVWHVLSRDWASVRAIQIVMCLCVVAGLVGMVLHYRGNLEFQLEIDPTQSHWELFRKVIHAKAPPALAPGAMTQLGLLGLAYAFRHPALAKRTDSIDSRSVT